MPIVDPTEQGITAFSAGGPAQAGNKPPVRGIIDPTENGIHASAQAPIDTGSLVLTAGQTSPEQLLESTSDVSIPPPSDDQSEAFKSAQTAIDAPGAAIHRGLQDIGEGVKQTALEAGELGGVVEKGRADEYTQQVEEGRRLYEQKYGEMPGADELRIIASIAPYIYLPIKGAPSLPAQMARTGVAGGAIAGSQFVPEGESRAETATIGAAVGAAVPPVVRGASTLVSKVFNAMSGKLRPEAAEVFSLGRKHTVPVFVPDVEKGPIVSKLSTATESLPGVGMGGRRKIQNVAAERAAVRLKGKFDSSGDWTKTIQVSLRDHAAVVKNNAKKLYDKVANLADKKGVIPPVQMNKTAAGLLKDELSQPAIYQDKALVKILEKYSTDPQANFSKLRQLRSDIGSDIDDYYKGANALVGKKGVGKLQKIKNSLEQDMDSFSTTNGNDINAAWRKADTYYRKRVIPFKDTAIAKASKTDTPDEIYKTFIKRGARDRAVKFYNALDQKGKSAVRFGMIEDAYKTATHEGRPFSPARFSTRLESLQDASGVFFKGKDKALIDGFQKLMRHVERSGQFMENPPTGNRVIPILLAGGVAVEPGATAAIAGISLALKTLFVTEAGKRLMFSASIANKGAMPALVNRLEGVLARTSAASADPPEGPQQ